MGFKNLLIVICELYEMGGTKTDISKKLSIPYEDVDTAINEYFNSFNN